MGLALTIYSSINSFFAMLCLEYKIYQESKKDDSKDLYFILLIIFKIMEKCNLQIIDIFAYCSKNFIPIRSRAIILLHLESMKNSLDIVGEETELYKNIKKRFNKLTK